MVRRAILRFLFIGYCHAEIPRCRHKQTDGKGCCSCACCACGPPLIFCRHKASCMIESRPPAEERRWRLETEDFAADWRGFLFVRGHTAGEDSVRRLWREFRARGPEQALSLGRGSFSFTLLDKQTGVTFACTDAFGLVQLFVAEDRIGDDLIRTVRQLPRDDTALDRDGLAAFMRYGSYILGRTVDRRVRVLGGSEIVKWTADSGLQFLRKESADRHGFEFDAYVTDLKTAAAGERISLDLTGGIDSRLLAAAFSH